MTCCSSQNQGKLERSAQKAADGDLAKPLTLSYGDRQLGAGFHVTEAKSSTVNSLDCGSNRHSWNETTIQLLDIEGAEETRMQAQKLLHILEKAGVRLDDVQRGQIIFEIGRPDEALQLHDFAGLQISGENVMIKTHPRHAVCKPASVHKLAAGVSGCCGPKASAGSPCCA